MFLVCCIPIYYNMYYQCQVAAADEANVTLSIVVRCEDNGKPSLYRDEAFIIAVIDANELPTKLSLSDGVITENN